MAKLDPIVSEFETDEDAEAYDKWFREQVEAGLAERGPGVPHSEVMRRLDELLAQAKGKPRSEAYDEITSEFRSKREADSYDQWFRAQVEDALNSSRPLIPGDEVRRRTAAVIARHRNA